MPSVVSPIRVCFATIVVALAVPFTASAAEPPRAPFCPVELAAIARVEVVPRPEADDDACVVPTPVRMSAIRLPEGEVALTGEPVLHCPFALALARWTRDIAAPLARGDLGARLTALGTGNGFQCRRRNRAKTGRLSEHAFGNAVDIVSFRFDAAEPLAVQAAEGLSAPEASYLQAVRAAACGYFTTILGPGSNAAHATHLHFDLGRAWKDGELRKNPYRICE